MRLWGGDPQDGPVPETASPPWAARPEPRIRGAQRTDVEQALPVACALVTAQRAGLGGVMDDLLRPFTHTGERSAEAVAMTAAVAIVTARLGTGPGAGPDEAVGTDETALARRAARAAAAGDLGGVVAELTAAADNGALIGACGVLVGRALRHLDALGASADDVLQACALGFAARP